MRFHRLRVAVYLLYAISFVLPAAALDFGSWSGDPNLGWMVFAMGPVVSYAAIHEPGSEPLLAFLGAYYLVAWTANFAMLLPLARKLPLRRRTVAARLFAFFAWSVLACYLLLPKSLIDELSFGYFAWAVAVTLVLPCLRAEATGSDHSA
jgi:hypothetical protein